MPNITTYYKGAMLFQSRIGSHSLLTDVPASMGGSDRAPTPPELFIASLGTCVAALVVQYCDRNDIDTRDMTVDVDFRKTDQPTRLTDIVVTINMPHASCQDREGAIRRVAEHCPVHATIANLDEIKFVLMDQASVPAIESEEA
jgi:uncharacterized OsmC-like protein